MNEDQVKGIIHAMNHNTMIPPDDGLTLERRVMLRKARDRREAQAVERIKLLELKPNQSLSENGTVITKKVERIYGNPGTGPDAEFKAPERGWFL